MFCKNYFFKGAHCYYDDKVVTSRLFWLFVQRWFLFSKFTAVIYFNLVVETSIQEQ